MKIFSHRNQTIIEFDSGGDVSNSIQKEEQTDLLGKFILVPQYFTNLPQIYHAQIEKFKKKVIAFAVQYGTKNQKTTSIFLNFLEQTRQIATNYLKSRDYFKAATFYVYCLNFADPDDEVFMQKFITIKIDIVNKLLHCLFQLEYNGTQEIHNQGKYFEHSYNFMEYFMTMVQDYGFYKNLFRSQNCQIQLCYFFWGKLYKRKRNINKAIQKYQKVQDIIEEKLKNKTLNKHLHLTSFLINLKIKTDYKISKCYRQENCQDKKIIYEKMALKNAKQHNRGLYLYINKKVRFFEKKKAFQTQIVKLDGKKKIEDQVMKAIQQTKQGDPVSLYDVYQDQYE